MSLEDLEEDEEFILYLSVGILGAIFVGAFLLIMMDGWIFAYSSDDDDDDQDENGEYQYLGDQMMQTRQSSMHVLQQQQLQQQQQQQPPEQPIQQQQRQQQQRSLPQQSDPGDNKVDAAAATTTSVNINKAAEPTETTAITTTTKTLAVGTIPSAEGGTIPPVPPRGIDQDEEEESSSSDEEEELEQRGSSKDEMGDSTRRRHQLSLQGTVVPRMEKIPFTRFIYLSVLVAVPTTGYIMYFTAMGWGEVTFYWMTENFGQYAQYVGGGTAFFLTLLYLLDANFWKSRCLKSLCLELLVLGTVTTVLLLTGDYPYGPICCYAAITPLWLISCNQFKCLKGNIRTRDYVSSLSGPLFFCSIITLFGFLGWTFASAHHQYNEVTKVAYSQATGCVPNLAEYPHCALNYTPTIAPTTTTSGTTVTTTNFTVTTAPGSNNNNNNNNNNNRVRQRQRSLHNVPAWLEHEPHDDDDNTDSNNNDSPPPPQPPKEPQDDEKEEVVNIVGGSTTTTKDDSVDAEDIQNLNEENTDNVYTAEETGVCFDTVVSPPAFFPRHDDCLADGCPEKLYNDCLNAFILWAGPLLCSMVLFFLSFFCTFLKGEDAERDIINFGKLWLFLLFSMWLTAALSGVAGGLSSALVAMTLASFVGSIVFVATTRSKEESKQQGAQVWGRIEENYGAYMDVARGLFLVTCAPFILLYLVFSVFNQAIRKLGLPCSKPLKTPQQRADFLTKRTRSQVTAFLSWDRSKVLTYAVYWGIAFLILQVFVSQFTVVFLSWLIESTSSLNLGLVTAILVGVGMIMFLLPPVPGVPIYLTLGIVILAVGQELLGLYGAIAYAAGVSLALKLIACTVQQKLIGEFLAGYVSVRKLVGINSTLIKGMRLVLAQPGMGIDKVCILVGGPDWPTSVLCGIMGLDLLPVLVGTLPVFLLILPTVLTGSFTYMAGLKDPETGELLYPYASVLFSVSFAVTGLVQFGAMILAAYYLEQTTSQRAEELAAIPIDKEVAELEEAETEFNDAYDKVTQWPVVPTVMRLILYMSFITIVASCYLVMFWASSCFAEFELGTSTIDDALGGKWWNILLPLGWGAIALFLGSCVLLYVFISWASAKAKKEVANSPQQAGAQQAGETTTNNQLVVAQGN